MALSPSGNIPNFRNRPKKIFFPDSFDSDAPRVCITTDSVVYHCAIIKKRIVFENMIIECLNRNGKLTEWEETFLINILNSVHDFQLISTKQFNLIYKLFIICSVTVDSLIVDKIEPRVV